MSSLAELMTINSNSLLSVNRDFRHPLDCLYEGTKTVRFSKIQILMMMLLLLIYFFQLFLVLKILFLILTIN